MARRLWKLTTGVEEKPADEKDSKGKLVVPVDAEELAIWEDKDAQALAMIIGTTANAVIPHIQMADTSVEAWATLKDLYETDNTSRILTPQHELFNLEMNEGDGVHDHLTKVKVVRDKLAAVG